MSEPIRAVERALDILACFSQAQLSLSLTQIADQVGMPKSTVFRLLATLEGKRFVSRNPATGLYHLSFRFVEMGSLVLQDLDIQQWALPYLQHLAAETGETVDLAALDGEDVIYLQVVESPQRVRLAAATGQRLPAHCTASGKAFLAFLPEERRKTILSGRMRRFTSFTQLQVEEIEADLERTRERGFAISEQEYEKDIHAVAAPVLDPGGYPIVAVAIAGPSFRLSRDRMLTLGRSLRTLTARIGNEVGPATLTALLNITNHSQTPKERHL